MNIRVLMKAAIITSSFLMLLLCRDLFVMGLVSAQFMYINVDRLRDDAVLALALQSLILVIISLMLTTAVLGCGMKLWERVTRT